MKPYFANSMVIMAAAMMIIGTSAYCLDFPGTKPGDAKVLLSDSSITVCNAVISESWSVKDGRLKPGSLTDKISGASIEYDQAKSEAFRIMLGDGRTINASDCRLLGKPHLENIEGNRSAPRVSERSYGKQVVIDLSIPGSELKLRWRAILRNGSNYIRQAVSMSTSQSDILVKRIVLVSLTPKSTVNARVVGTCPGSPIVTGNLFLAYEHANSDAEVHQTGLLEAGLNRNSSVKPGHETVQVSVAGVTPEGQLRRGFLYYIERERAYPYRPFMHYNSWYDLRPPTETDALDVINSFGRELVEKRGVKLSCFAWDDGWDDPKSLWQIDKTLFPHGWAPLLKAGKKYGIPMGLWMSPFGGYGEKRTLRAQYARERGIKTGPDDTFSLAQANYYDIFFDTSMKALKDLGCVYFKYDGLTASRIEETEAAFGMVDDLRKVRPNLFVNLTTGTWPSAYYLWYGDSIWRSGQDWAYEGKGTPRNRWVNYRDATTYRNVVTGGPLYPLNSLMTHGFIVGRTEEQAAFGTDPIELRDDMHDTFGSGTATLELYVTTNLMSQRNWDDLAESSKWYLGNTDVLVDTHWVGGNPSKGEIYGWASWSKRKGILTLRNPNDVPGTITIDIGKVFELPKHAATTYVLSSPWKADTGKEKITLRAGEPHTISVAPFDVLVFDAMPVK